jgi:hypothetical protein
MRNISVTLTVTDNLGASTTSPTFNVTIDDINEGMAHCGGFGLYTSLLISAFVDRCCFCHECVCSRCLSAPTFLQHPFKTMNLTENRYVQCFDRILTSALTSCDTLSILFMQ